MSEMSPSLRGKNLGAEPNTNKLTKLAGKFNQKNWNPLDFATGQINFLKHNFFRCPISQDLKTEAGWNGPDPTPGCYPYTKSKFNTRFKFPTVQNYEQFVKNNLQNDKHNRKIRPRMALGSPEKKVNNPKNII